MGMLISVAAKVFVYTHVKLAVNAGGIQSENIHCHQAAHCKRKQMGKQLEAAEENEGFAYTIL